MSKFDTLFIVISITFGAICYVGTNDFICAGAVLMTSILYFFFIARKMTTNYLKKSHRFHSCYTFINSFIISLSIKGSLMSAFESTKLNMDKQYISIYEGLSIETDEDKLTYLEKYFPFDIYKLFVSVVKIFQTQGGDVFTLSKYLTNELRKSEDYLITCEGMVKRKVVDFIVLWFFTLVILVILRFSLLQFYTLISNLIIFKVSVVGLFLLIILSIHVLIMKIVSIEFRGYKNV